jgi:hypothetical protein
LAPVRQTIYSLNPDLRQIFAGSNHRYLAFLSALDIPIAGIKALNKIAAPVRDHDRPYRGFNLFYGADQLLLETLCRGEFAIAGFRNKDLRSRIPGATTPQVSRSLKRLRLHGLVKQVAGTFKYYLTDLGRRTVIAALTLKQMTLVPTLAAAATPA